MRRSHDNPTPAIGLALLALPLAGGCHAEAAAKASEAAQRASGRHEREIVTAIAPAGCCYRAEEQHQRYLEKRGGDPRPSGRS